MYYISLASSSLLLLSRKVLMNSFVNLSRLVFIERSLYFFLFPVPSFSFFLCITPKTIASFECFLMNYSILGPSNFLRSNTWIFSLLYLLQQSLFTTFLRLKNLSTISSKYEADKESSIIRNIWGNFSLVHWYKTDHMLDGLYCFILQYWSAFSTTRTFSSLASMIFKFWRASR